MSYTKIATHLLSLLTCALMLAAVVVQRDGRVFGHDLKPSAEVQADSVVLRQPDGSLTVNTTSIAKDIIGYGGPVPLQIELAGGVVSDVVFLRNAETPSFLESVEPLLDKWNGLTPEQVLSLDVDAVSGATYSSSAVIATMHRAMDYMQNNSVAPRPFYADFEKWLSPAFIVSLLVVLCGAIVPLFFKHKVYRLVQLTLNVAILGFWCGTFINYTMILSFFANGINVIGSFVSVVLLVVAFIYPLFGHKSHYCNWICPLGSIQELAGRAVPYKLRLSPGLVKGLDIFRQVLWAVLMLLMWTGVYFSWIDYELFTAFLFGDAAIGVVAAAVVVVALSTVVNRPYCRFVCPTGCLFHTAQLSETPKKSN